MIVEGTMNTRDFLENKLLKEIQRLQNNGFYYLSYIVISQAIEFIGAFLDSKPIRARGQSKRRFRNALSQLFSGRYELLNSNDFLYDKLRSHITHSIFPSTWLFLTSRKENPDLKHLSKYNGKLVFIAEDFFEDFSKACLRLISLIENGDLKDKKLANDYAGFKL